MSTSAITMATIQGISYICKNRMRGCVTSVIITNYSLPKSKMDVSTIHVFLFLRITSALVVRFLVSCPIPIIPPQTNMKSDHITKACELPNLLCNFTAAEKAAIRQITPTLSIVRLSQGSLASKGNTSCVWHKSRLTRILPNLPAECKFIVVKRISNNNSHSSIKLTKKLAGKHSKGFIFVEKHLFG
jgi:hypothetical protein